MEGVVDLAVFPQVVQEDGELSLAWPGQASDCDDGALLGILPAPLGELESPTTQVAVRPEGTEEILGALHEQPAQVAVTGLACPGGLGQG